MDINTRTVEVMEQHLIPMGTTPEQYRASVMSLTDRMMQLPQVECPLTHRFAPGVYSREIFIPAGTIIIGKIHRHEHLNFLLEGEITVVTEEGSRRLKAPCTFVAPAFTKKAAYAHTDVRWTNVHATSETDVEKIEDEMVLPSYDDPEFLAHIRTTLSLEV